MSILNSLIFGSRGAYELPELFKIYFIDYNSPRYPETFPQLFGSTTAYKITATALRMFPFCILTQPYLNLSASAVGRALAIKLLTKRTPEIIIFRDILTYKLNTPSLSQSSNWYKTALHIADSISVISLSSCRLIAAAAAKDTALWPVSIILGGEALFSISANLLNTATCIISESKKTFTQLSGKTKRHIAIGITALAAQCALGVFAMLKLKT